MATERTPDLRLFFDILQTLNRINAPYMIIGGFAAAIYGNNRTTYDIDIVVDLHERHIQALAAAYPRRATMPIPSKCATQFGWASRSTLLTGRWEIKPT